MNVEDHIDGRFPSATPDTLDQAARRAGRLGTIAAGVAAACFLMGVWVDGRWALTALPPLTLSAVWFATSSKFAGLAAKRRTGDGV